MADDEDEELDEETEEELEKEEKENENYYDEPSRAAADAEFRRIMRDVAEDFARRH